jgi:hypothetical protein
MTFGSAPQLATPPTHSSIASSPAVPHEALQVAPLLSQYSSQLE